MSIDVDMFDYFLERANMIKVHLPGFGALYKLENELKPKYEHREEIKNPIQPPQEIEEEEVEMINPLVNIEVEEPIEKPEEKPKEKPSESAKPITKSQEEEKTEMIEKLNMLQQKELLPTTSNLKQYNNIESLMFEVSLVGATKTGKATKLHQDTVTDKRSQLILKSNGKYYKLFGADSLTEMLTELPKQSYYARFLREYDKVAFSQFNKEISYANKSIDQLKKEKVDYNTFKKLIQPLDSSTERTLQSMINSSSKTDEQRESLNKIAKKIKKIETDNFVIIYYGR